MPQEMTLYPIRFSGIGKDAYTLTVDDDNEAHLTEVVDDAYHGPRQVTRSVGSFLAVTPNGDPYTLFGITYEPVLVITTRDQWHAYRRIDAQGGK